MLILFFCVIISTKVFAQAKTGWGPDLDSRNERIHFNMIEDKIKDFLKHVQQRSKQCIQPTSSKLWEDKNLFNLYFTISLKTIGANNCRDMQIYLDCIKDFSTERTIQDIIDDPLTYKYFKWQDSKITEKDVQKMLLFFRDFKLDCNNVGISCGM